MKFALNVAMLFVAVTAFAQKPVRLSWQEFAKDPQRVQSFRDAVAMMKSRNTADPKSATYRTSWEYWGAIHGFFGTQSSRGTVAQWRADNGLDDPSYDTAFAGVVDQTPPDAIAAATWGQCQHGTDFFFPWHRLYLFYFEQVLQSAANDKSLRLPYWDYTNTAYLGMPGEFTSPTYTNLQGQSVANPLFEARRAPGWEAPGTNALDPHDTDIDLALDNPYFLNTTDRTGNVVAGYQRTIELKPHGDVHCGVMPCRATVMGAVPYSSNDPIFYVHHANIDRLWDCWTSIAGHKNPATTAWRNKQYSFVDANGAQVTKFVRNLFDGSLIDYVYQQPSKCERSRSAASVSTAAVAPATVRAASAMLTEPMMIGEQQDDVKINAMVTRKRVTLPGTGTLGHPRQFALREQTQLRVATELILRGVRFDEHPRTRFRIYLERTDDPSRRGFVGTMSFFAAEEADGPHAGHGGEDHRVFDATRALRSLRLEGTGTHEVNVVFEAMDEPIGPDFDPAHSKLVVDEIELRVKRDL